MECVPKIPGQIVPKPLFPDGREEIIKMLLPGKECAFPSGFLEGLIKATIARNKPKVDCKKPQKSSKTLPGENSEQNEKPLPPIDPAAIDPDRVGLWGFSGRGSWSKSVMASFYESKWSGGADYVSRIGQASYGQSVSILSHPDNPDYVLFKTTTNVSRMYSATNEFVGPASRISGAMSSSGISYSVIDISTKTQVWEGIFEKFPPSITESNSGYGGEFIFSPQGSIFFLYGAARQIFSQVFAPREDNSISNQWVSTSYSETYQLVWTDDILPPDSTQNETTNGDNGMNGNDECCCDCVEAVAAVMEAYMEKIAPMFEDLKKYINTRLIEETNDLKKYLDTQLYKQSEFIQKQILELDDQQIDFTPVINQIKTTEQNLWTGATLQINSSELPSKE